MHSGAPSSGWQVTARVWSVQGAVSRWMQGCGQYRVRLVGGCKGVVSTGCGQ